MFNVECGKWLPERILDFAGIQAGMHESRKMWQPGNTCETDEQVVKGITSPSRAEYWGQ